MSSIGHNNDFLSQSNSEPSKNKRRTALQIEMDEYPEYYALNISQKKSLDASNYWRVMNGEPVIKVPLSDENYHKYFNKNCYKLKDAYQKQKNYVVKISNISNKNNDEPNRIDVPKIEATKDKINDKIEIEQKRIYSKVEEPKIERPIPKIVTEQKPKTIKKAPENNNKQQKSLF